MRKILGCYFIAITSMARSASAQSFPDAAHLLAAQGELLKTSSTVQYTSVQEMEMNIMGNAMKIPTTSFSQFAQPDKFRMESKSAGVVAMILGYDGETTWMYMPPQKIFSRQKGMADGQSLSAQFIDLLGGPQELSTNAKVLRSEVLDIDGQPHDCWVVESKIEKITIKAGVGGNLKDSVYTFWIDKQTGLALRTMVTGTVESLPGAGASQIKTTTTLHDVKINLALPDSTFQFTPPADAKETPDIMAAITGGMIASTQVRSTERNRIGPGSGAVQAERAGQPQLARAPAATPQPPASKFSPQAYVPELHPTHRVEAKYPDQAKRDKIAGFVTILATIDPSGSVVETEVLAGDDILRQPAIDAVKQWRYHPVLRNGQAVYAYTNVEVHVSDPANEFPDNDSKDAYFVVANGTSSSSNSMNRMMELMRTMPRTPQQELADLENDLGDGTGMDRFWILPQLAKAALKAGAFDKASAYANDMLKGDAKDPNYGQLLHDGHTTRGLVAMHQGNTALASQDLREAGQTTGSPTLNSFGPDLSLANELLKKGERTVVLEYLERCKTFWKLGEDRLDSWIAAIRNGETPELGGGFGF